MKKKTSLSPSREAAKLFFCLSWRLCGLAREKRTGHAILEKPPQHAEFSLNLRRSTNLLGLFLATDFRR
jgi:hypothetical protein